MKINLVAGLVAGIALGVTAGIANATDKIVSVSGNVTEMVYLLGGEDRLVGSDTTSYFPPVTPFIS